MTDDLKYAAAIIEYKEPGDIHRAAYLVLDALRKTEAKVLALSDSVALREHEIDAFKVSLLKKHWSCCADNSCDDNCQGWPDALALAREYCKPEIEASNTAAKNWKEVAEGLSKESVDRGLKIDALQVELDKTKHMLR